MMATIADTFKHPKHWINCKESGRGKQEDRQQQREALVSSKYPFNNTSVFGWDGVQKTRVIFISSLCTINTSTYAPELGQHKSPRKLSEALTNFRSHVETGVMLLTS